MYVNEMTGWNDHKSMSILLSIYSATSSIASYINSTVREDICNAEYSSFVGEFCINKTSANLKVFQISSESSAFKILLTLKNFNFFDFFTRNFQYFAFLQNFLSILMFCRERERERKKALTKFHHVSTSNINKCYSVITLCTFIFLQK